MQAGKHMGSQSAKSEWQPAVIGTERHLRRVANHVFHSVGSVSRARPARQRSDGWSHGVTSILRSVPCEGRGENSRVGRAARIWRMRLPPEMAGPIFDFSAKISGGL
jgi:hypothetical protein